MRRTILLLITLFCLPTFSQAQTATPSNPNASSKARAVLQYLYNNMGNHTLSGQESMLWDSSWGNWVPSSRDQYVHKKTGKYPAVYSSDFGDFAGDTVKDRGKVVDAALAYAQHGSIIELHYHMVQPDKSDGSGFNTLHIAGTDYGTAKIDQILKPGTSLNVEHLKRLDQIAGYLKVLRDKGVVVLWRPYHEMNGNWFWWSHQPRYKELWVQMWDRFTNYHKLNNLLWVFSCNYWHSGASGFNLPDRYYPGHNYVDIVGVDVYVEYSHSYDRRVHDALLKLGHGKPIAITENGEMPNISKIKESQPNWVYWVTWMKYETADHGNTDALYRSVYSDPSVITRDEIDIPAIETYGEALPSPKDLRITGISN